MSDQKGDPASYNVEFVDVPKGTAVCVIVGAGMNSTVILYKRGMSAHMSLLEGMYTFRVRHPRSGVEVSMEGYWLGNDTTIQCHHVKAEW